VPSFITSIFFLPLRIETAKDQREELSDAGRLPNFHAVAAVAAAPTAPPVPAPTLPPAPAAPAARACTHSSRPSPQLRPPAPPQALRPPRLCPPALPPHRPPATPPVPASPPVPQRRVARPQLRPTAGGVQQGNFRFFLDIFLGIFSRYFYYCKIC
jgi:hypothetical protein